MKKQRTVAKYTGYSLILMALIAGFSLGYAFPKIYDTNQPELVQKTLSENLGLYKVMLLGILLIIILDIAISWTLYLYFKNDNRKIALYSFIFRIIYTFIFFVATYFLAQNIGQESNSTVIENFKSFEFIWSIGLIIFGIHLLIVGLLMKLHKLIPRILWYLTIMAGASYILFHILKTTFPQLTELTDILNNILALPMALGELGLAIWLIVKGGKTEEQKTTNR
jgi:magnesium-transporting ATPase (P-type)